MYNKFTQVNVVVLQILKNRVDTHIGQGGGG